MSNSETKTHWKKLHNPDYLGAWSLDPGMDMILTIDSVKKEPVTGADGKKEDCTVARFKEDVKPMILNATNSKIIEKIYGTPYIEDWKGKPIQIYAAKIRAFGEEMDALRIRPQAPKTERPELTPDNPRWGGAVKSLSEGKTSMEGILKHFELSAQNQKKLQSEADDLQTQNEQKNAG